MFLLRKIFITLHRFQDNIFYMTFILSDETLNSQGFVVLTKGIDITAFAKNPIMLYMHQRATVVGRWENIRIENNKLMADPVFDTSTELGKTVMQQVNNGFLRSASIGIDIIEEKQVNKVTTVTKCKLFEASIVDVPSNENALKLYYKDNLKRLAFTTDTGNTPLKDQICKELGLPNKTDDSIVISEIMRLSRNTYKTYFVIEEAVSNGLLCKEDKELFINILSESPRIYEGLILKKKEERQEKATCLINNAVKEGKINPVDRALYISISEKLDVKLFGELINKIPKRVKLSEMINQKAEPEEPRVKNLDYYRKYEPECLREDPELFQSLLSSI